MRRKRPQPVPPASEQSSDAELLRAIAAGQTAALRLLHHRHAGWLRARLRRRCADPDVVDAAVQDTFVAVWKDAHRYEVTTADAAAWLWTIAVRRLLSALRGQADTDVTVIHPQDTERFTGVSVLSCQTHREIRYCALPHHEGWIDLWRAAVEPVSTHLPPTAVRPAADGWTTAQRAWPVALIVIVFGLVLANRETAGPRGA